MPQISETFTVPRTPSDVLSYVADFATTAEWDPGVSRARRLTDAPVGRGSRFEVHLDLGVLTLPLVYEVTAYEPDQGRVVLETSTWVIRGRDEVTVTEHPQGAVVEWEAAFGLRGPGRLLNPLLLPGLRRAGARAIVGLRDVLSTTSSRPVT